MPENTNKTAEDMLYLSACVLHDTVPEADRLESMDIAELYRMSRFHTMTAMVCMALEVGNVLTEERMAPQLIKKWQDAKNKAVRKNMLLDAERHKLFTFMERQGSWYMPLKGSILKDLYPKFGMRQMADNDILFDATYQHEVEDYMVGQGYEAVRVGKDNHDVYKKPPIYNFELHTALLGAAHNEIWLRYYEKVKDRLIKDEGNACGYHFSDEDFYIYLMLHAFKHYNGGGTGLRSLLDCYVYIWKKGETLDWKYIEAEAEKLEIADFEKESRALSSKLFADPLRFYDIYEMELSEKEQEMLWYLYGSGTYGTMQNRVSKKLKALQEDGKPISKKTKWKYYIRRVFPELDWFRQFCPFCYRHRWVIPLFCVYRVFRGVFFRRKGMQCEVQAVQKAE